MTVHTSSQTVHRSTSVTDAEDYIEIQILSVTVHTHDMNALRSNMSQLTFSALDTLEILFRVLWHGRREKGFERERIIVM
jgi:hypothetical protein